MRLSAQRVEELSVIKINEKKIERFKSFHKLTGKTPVMNLQLVLVEVETDMNRCKDQHGEEDILSLYPSDEIELVDEEEDFLENLSGEEENS